MRTRGGRVPSRAPSPDRHKGEEAESRAGPVKAGMRGAGSSRSELGGAAGVALQQAHDGRVALGPADELLQGQLACGRAGCEGTRGREGGAAARRVPPRPRPCPAPASHRRCWCPSGGRFSQSSFPGSTRPPASSSRTKPSCKWPGGRQGSRGEKSPVPRLGNVPGVLEAAGRGGGGPEVWGAGARGRLSRRGRSWGGPGRVPWRAGRERNCWLRELHAHR